MPITADFNPLYVTAGGKAVNVSDRTAPILTRHCRFTFVYQFVAADDIWVPTTTTRTMFVNGIDDTVASPFTAAGISIVTQPNNSVAITDAYKGGAWSEDFDCILLACGAVLQGPPRIITNSATITDNLNVAVGLNTGTQGIESAQTDDFVQAAINGAQLQILPTGSNTACAAYLGLLRLQQAGYSSTNSPNFTGLGRNDGDSRYGFNTTVIVEGNRGNVAGFTPNRIECDFLGAASANVNTGGQGVTTGVQRLPALAARADKTLLALDFDLVVHYARIQVGEERNDAGQMVPAYQGAYEVDRRKIRRFLGQDSICAI